MSTPTSSRERLRRARRAVRRAVLARRRLLAALCAAVAVVAGVRAVVAAPPPTEPVISAAHDLAAGTVLEAADLQEVPQPQGTAPAGLVDDAVGRTLASPVRAGEPITDVRLVGEGLADAHPELATMPVRLPDAGQAALLAPGDRIDLIATDPEGGTSRVVAPGALVLAIPSVAADTAAASPPGALVLLGVPPTAATELAEASVRWFLSFAFSR